MIHSVLAYVGPEAALPLLSVLAAIGGALLVGWRFVASFFRRIWRLMTGRGAAAPKSPPQAVQAATQPDPQAPADAEGPVAAAAGGADYRRD